MAFLGIKIPTEISRSISNLEIDGVKQDSAKLHITLFYFEKEVSITAISKILKSTFKVVSGDVKPFTLKADKISSFQKEGSIPVILPIKSKELIDLREQLRAQFKIDEITFDESFSDYKPHITLAYAESFKKDVAIDKIEIPVSEIVFFSGKYGCSDRIIITFPLNICVK